MSGQAVVEEVEHPPVEVVEEEVVPRVRGIRTDLKIVENYLSMITERIKTNEDEFI